MSLGIGKQPELPRRPGDYRTAKGDMNKVPEHAVEEATEMAARHGKDAPAGVGGAPKAAAAKPAAAPAAAAPAAAPAAEPAAAAPAADKKEDSESAG